MLRIRATPTAPESPTTPAVRSVVGRLFIDLCVLLGNTFFMVGGEERKGGIQKRKRKKKKNHLQHEHLGSRDKAMPPEQNGGSEPEAGPGRARKLGVVELGAGAAPGPEEQSSSERPPSHRPMHSRRKRARKRNPRFRGLTSESAASPLEDLCQGGLSNGHSQALVSQVSPASGAPAPKRKRKLRAPWINGSPPTLAWPPPQEEGPAANPTDGEDCPASLPQGRRLKKKRGEPGHLDLYNPHMQKTAIFKKRKKMKEMLNLVEHSRVLESELKLVQTLVRRLGSRQGGQGSRAERPGALASSGPNLGVGGEQSRPLG